MVADGLLVGRTIGPLLGIAALVGVAGMLGQSGFVLATEPLKWNWEKLSPASGLARLKPSQSGVELLKSVLMATALGVIAWRVIDAMLADGGLIARMAPGEAARYGWESIRRLLWQGALAMLAVGVADYLVQRWRTTNALKMTKQEVRDEAKASEGSPEMKARIRHIQREMTRRRMLKAVETATVVITNPTHYAVALQYDADDDGRAGRGRQGRRSHGRPHQGHCRAGTACRSSRTSRSRRRSTRAPRWATPFRPALRRGRRSARVPRAHQAVML